MRSKFLLTLLLLLVIVAVLFGLYRDQRIQAGFLAIEPHATEAAIRSSLGAPSKVDTSCEAYGTQLAENCDHVLVYRSSFAPLRPRYWLVFIDATGQTSATSRQSEP